MREGQAKIEDRDLKLIHCQILGKRKKKRGSQSGGRVKRNKNAVWPRLTSGGLQELHQGTQTEKRPGIEFYQLNFYIYWFGQRF